MSCMNFQMTKAVIKIFRQKTDRRIEENWEEFEWMRFASVDMLL